MSTWLPVGGCKESHEVGLVCTHGFVGILLWSALGQLGKNVDMTAHPMVPGPQKVETSACAKSAHPHGA